jgi:hypothetical protein
VQTPNDQELFFFIQVYAFTRVRERGIEPFIERLNRIENAREHEIQQGPEFRQVILNRKIINEQNRLHNL